MYVQRLNGNFVSTVNMTNAVVQFVGGLHNVGHSVSVSRRTQHDLSTYVYKIAVIYVVPRDLRDAAAAYCTRLR